MTETDVTKKLAENIGTILGRREKITEIHQLIVEHVNIQLQQERQQFVKAFQGMYDDEFDPDWLTPEGIREAINSLVEDVRQQERERMESVFNAICTIAHDYAPKDASIEAKEIALNNIFTIAKAALKELEAGGSGAYYQAYVHRSKECYASDYRRHFAWLLEK